MAAVGADVLARIARAAMIGVAAIARRGSGAVKNRAEKQHVAETRDTSVCACPASPGPAACASGVSSRPRVSTKTFTGSLTSRD